MPLALSARWPACLTVPPSGASSAAAGFAAKRHLFGIYGPYANSRRRHARNWLRDNLPESAYKGIINTKRAIFGPHHGPYED